MISNPKRTESCGTCLPSGAPRLGLEMQVVCQIHNGDRSLTKVLITVVLLLSWTYNLEEKYDTIEYFAGKARIAKCARRMDTKTAALGIALDQNPAFNILTPSGFATLACNVAQVAKSLEQNLSNLLMQLPAEAGHLGRLGRKIWRSDCHARRGLLQLDIHIAGKLAQKLSQPNGVHGLLGSSSCQSHGSEDAL